MLKSNACKQSQLKTAQFAEWYSEIEEQLPLDRRHFQPVISI